MKNKLKKLIDYWGQNNFALVHWSDWDLKEAISYANKIGMELTEKNPEQRIDYWTEPRKSKRMWKLTFIMFLIASENE